MPVCYRVDFAHLVIYMLRCMILYGYSVSDMTYVTMDARLDTVRERVRTRPQVYRMSDLGP